MFFTKETLQQLVDTSLRLGGRYTLWKAFVANKPPKWADWTEQQLIQCLVWNANIDRPDLQVWKEVLVID